MNKEEFISKVKELGVTLTEKNLQDLEVYANFLLEYNKHTNLTAIKDLPNIYLKHFYDSLTITKEIDLNEIKTLADIGTGAGFPGLVLKIVYPHLKVTLIDSNNKKVKFLQELITKLELPNIEALNVRSETYALNNLDVFDLVTARAVTTLPVLIELCLPLVKVGGYFIPLKGNASEELEKSKSILKTLQGKIEHITEFSLPYENAVRTIIKIKKNNVTPKGYPRNYDKIKKSLKKIIK